MDKYIKINAEIILKMLKSQSYASVVFQLSDWKSERGNSEFLLRFDGKQVVDSLLRLLELLQRGAENCALLFYDETNNMEK